MIKYSNKDYCSMLVIHLGKHTIYRFRSYGKIEWQIKKPMWSKGRLTVNMSNHYGKTLWQAMKNAYWDVTGNESLTTNI